MTPFSVAERARHLKLASLSLSEGIRSGGFRSCFRGQGMEFDAVRAYERGDDIRSIDWNVTARSGHPFVKMFREERELTVFIVFDASLSMETNGGSVTKREKALEAAALLAFAAGHNASPLGAVTFDRQIIRVFKPSTARDQILSVLAALEHDRASAPGSALAGALAGSARVLRSRSLVVVLSDFRTSGYEKNLALLARRHDVVAARVESPTDSSLPEAGLLPFRDPETGFDALLPTGRASFREVWEREHREHLSRWEQICLRRGVSPLVLSTEADSLRELNAFFAGTRR